MDGLNEQLARHTIIGLDTSIFIYHLEAHPTYLARTKVILGAVQSGQCSGVTSVITLMELTVLPWRLQKPAVAHEYEALLINFPHLYAAEVTRDITRQAAQLRAHYNLKPADALQVATALHYQATAFFTNDRQLRRLSDKLEIIVLDLY